MTATQDLTVRPEVVLASVQRVKSAMEAPLLFSQLCTTFGFDPLGPINLKYVPSKRDKHRAGKLTGLVWASLNADGTINPVKAVPVNVVNTNELPIVMPTKELGSHEGATDTMA